MSESDPMNADLPDAEAIADRRFLALDSYWEALCAGGLPRARQWLADHPEAGEFSPDLDALVALFDAEASIDTDSRLDSTGEWSTGSTVQQECAPQPLAEPLVEPVAQPLAQSLAQPVVPLSLLGPGVRFGKYQIERLLGRGGMGEVHLARDLVMDRDVALKVLLENRGRDAEHLQRFHIEIRALAKLPPHPHLAAVYDAGEHEGRLFVGTQYIPGTDLRAHVKHVGRLDVRTACDFIRQAALGLAEIHRRGIIHRDVKPSNLMLDSDHKVKVLDLGLARLAVVDSPRMDGDETAPGATLGTPHYMAPEQADDPHRAGEQSDLYSLGCTFYHLLTGRPPFVAGSYLAVLKAHAIQPPTPIRELRPDVPESVAAIVHRLLAKEPKDRHDSAEALIGAMDSCLAGLRPTREHERASAEGDIDEKLTELRKRLLAARTPWALEQLLYESEALLLRRPGLPEGRLLRSQILAALAATKPRASHRSWYALAGTVGLVALALVGYGLWQMDDPAGPWGPDYAKSASPFLPGLHFTVEHYRGVTKQGTMGITSKVAQFEDGVKLRVMLPEKAFCYLIALNTTGENQLVYPSDPNAPPALLQEFTYPGKNADGEERYFFVNDGVGLQAFVLICSRESLPSYTEWKNQLGRLPWKPNQLDQGWWAFDGTKLQGETQRGTVGSLPADVPPAFRELTDFLKTRLGADLQAQAIAFTVKEKP